MSLRRAWIGGALGALGVALVLGSPSADAAPPPDAEVDRVESEQDRVLAEAKRAGSVLGVVRTYESRLGRQPTPLNHYLLGRALFHAEDRAGARREMAATVAVEPDFWQAHVRLGSLAWMDKQPEVARQHLDLARRRAPDAADVLRLSAEVGFGTKDYDLAGKALARLSALHPDDLNLRAGLAEVSAARGDWEGAYRELRVLRVRDPKSVLVRLRYAEAALRTKRLDEAVSEAESVARVDGSGVGDPRVLRQALDVLRQAHVERKDWVALAGVLERVRPWIKPEHRAGLEEAIAALKSGKAPGEATAPPVPRGAVEPEEDALAALMARALGPDVAARRDALQTFFSLRVGWVPRPFLVRYHPAQEPDAECRAWVVRMIGALENQELATIPGHALQDPDPRVRRVAADALGETGSAAGLLYLLAYAGELPLAADAGEATVSEYNAARGALVRLTGFDDLPIGAERWVAAAQLIGSWARWRAWLDSAAGVEAKLKAIGELERIGESHPEWYLMVPIFVDPSPVVVRAAYRALLAHVHPEPPDERARRLWPTFPRVDAEALDAAGLRTLRERLDAWWKEWCAARPAPAR